MYFSATQIGKHFHLNGQEMNAVLKVLGILEGEPGNYSPTEFGKQFGRYNYFDNGYGGYAARSWDTIYYDESIINWISQRVNKEIIQDACTKLKEHNAEVKAAQIAAQEAFEAKLQKEKMAIAKTIQHSKNKKKAVITVLVIGGVVAIGCGIYIGIRKHKKQKELEKNKEIHNSPNS